MNSGLTSTQITELVTTYRDRCLWFLRHDYVPESSLEIRRTLDLIERYGDMESYRRVEAIRRWPELRCRRAS